MPEIRNNRIVFFNNKQNNLNKGTNFYINTSIFTGITSDNIYNIISFFDSNNNYKTDFDNKIIISSNLYSSNNDENTHKITLITQQQLFNNIKYIYKNNDFSKPKIVFFNNKNIYNNNRKYLFTSTDKDITDNVEEKVIKIINDNTIISNKSYPTNMLHIGFNFYKLYEKSSYYKFKFKDFLYKDLNSSPNNYTNNIDNNPINYKITNIELSNNFLNNNLINYDENNFKTLFYYKDNCLNDIKILNDNFITNEYDNIFLYNKCKNKTTIDVSYILQRSSDNDISYNLKVNFEIIKTNNITSPYYGKILINNNYINVNGYVLGENTKFFDKIQHLDFSNNNKIYLSYGNGITGITQENIKKSIKFENNSSTSVTKIFGTKILFKNSTSSSTSNSSSNTLNNNYLLDNSYNYDYINTFYIQKNQPIDPATNLPFKKFDISLLDYFNVSDFSSNFNNIEILNNNLYYNHYDLCYNDSKLFFKVENSNDTYLLDNTLNSNENFRLQLNINNDANYVNYNNINIFGESKQKITNKLYYDFRYNYSKTAYYITYLDILYELKNNEIFETQLKDLSNNLLLNFNKFVITNYFETSTGSDFTNVDCIFIYHDQEKTTDPSFLYPYNNIEIIRDVNIDNLSKAIELLPNSRTGTSNSIFLPARNGSNLSRKMIQGYIGMNNIPKLLSIEPYDPNVINNRGFNNQLNFQGGTLSADDLKLTDKDKVALKYESQKHSSQKNIVTNSRKNFASLVKQPSRSRNVNLNNSVVNCPNPINNITPNLYVTPFKFFRTGRGNYINSGK